MERTHIAEIYRDVAAFDGKTVTVAGWVRTVRDSKAFAFVELNDGTFRGCQIVAEREKLGNYDEIAHQNVGASLIVTGVVVATPQNKQPFEIKAASIAVEGESVPEYPLQKKRHSVEYLREIAHLRPRTNLFNAVFRIRSEAAFAIHSFFNERGFVYVHTPIITGSDCEGAGAMFQVTTLDLDKLKSPVDYKEDFFEKRASLTVSGQLDVETYAMAFANVYTFGPTFRAERSNTVRHAAEFWMIEPEMAFCDLAGDMEVAEAMVKYVIRTVMAKCRDEIAFLNQFVDKGLVERLTHVAESEFVRLPYTEAIGILERAVRDGVCSSPTTPRRSRRSTCASTTTRRRSRRRICSSPASESSSAAPSARSGWTYSGREWRSAGSKRRITIGISTSESTAARRTADSDSDSSA